MDDDGYWKLFWETGSAVFYLMHRDSDEWT